MILVGLCHLYSWARRSPCILSERFILSQLTAIFTVNTMTQYANRIIHGPVFTPYGNPCNSRPMRVYGNGFDTKKGPVHNTLFHCVSGVPA